MIWNPLLPRERIFYLAIIFFGSIHGESKRGFPRL